MRELVRSRAERTRTGTCVVEGPKLLDVALLAGVRVEAVYAEAGWDHPVLARCAVVQRVATGVIARVADTVTPQPLLAQVRIPAPPTSLTPSTFALFCVDVRDPGNAGTVIRAAEAAGASFVAFTPGSVDVWSPKTVRASAGAVFLLPVHAALALHDAARAATDDALAFRAATLAPGADTLDDLDLRVPSWLAFGNEAHGLDAALAALADDAPELARTVRPFVVPMAGRSESLNVAMCASVVAFEAARQQRRQRTPPAPGTPDSRGGSTAH